MTTVPLTPALAHLQAYADAVHRKDAPALAALYADDAVIFDAWDAWLPPLPGAAGVLAMATAWFASLGTASVQVSFSEVVSHTVADMAHVSAFVTYTAVSAQGQAMRAMTNRLSAVLACTGGGWRVVHEHTSVPVDFGAQRAVPFSPAAPSGG